MHYYRVDSPQSPHTYACKLFEFHNVVRRFSGVDRLLLFDCHNKVQLGGYWYEDLFYMV